MSKILESLTPEQMARWQTMTGKPFQGKIRRPGAAGRLNERGASLWPSTKSVMTMVYGFPGSLAQRNTAVWPILLLFADGDQTTANHWRPDSFLMSIISVCAFTLVGIVLSIIGFKLWDQITPGNLEVEICQKQNIAAAILGAAIILGVSIIVAASMIG
jgi:hypothetical protein